MAIQSFAQDSYVEYLSKTPKEVCVLCLNFTYNIPDRAFKFYRDIIVGFCKKMLHITYPNSGQFSGGEQVKLYKFLKPGYNLIKMKWNKCLAYFLSFLLNT